MWGTGWPHLLRQRSRRQRADQHLARPGSRRQGRAVTSFKSGDVRWPAISADGKVIVFEHDFGIWKLDVASRKATPIKLDIAAETQENLAEMRDFNSQADDYDLAPSGRRIVVLDPRRDFHRADR